MLRLPGDNAMRLVTCVMNPVPSAPTRTLIRSPLWYGWLAVTGTLLPNGPRSRWLPAAAHVGVHAPTSWTWTPCLPAGRLFTDRRIVTSLTPSGDGVSISAAEPTTDPSVQLLRVAFASGTS